MGRQRGHRTLPGAGFLLGAVVGCGLTAGALELRYVNWRPVVAPVDEPLHVRQDAKGDGHFLAPRSGNRLHRGIDLEAALESPVRAIRSGWVAEVGQHRGLGQFVELEHRRGLRSLYAHLSAVRVGAGGRVRQGEIIGAVGKTGNARHPWIAPHVHLEVWQGEELIDPRSLGLAVVDPDGESES